MQSYFDDIDENVIFDGRNVSFHMSFGHLMNSSSGNNNFTFEVEETDDYGLLRVINRYVLVPVCIFGFCVNVLAVILFNQSSNVVSGTSVYLNAILMLDVLQCVGTSFSTTPYFCDDVYQNEYRPTNSHKFCWFYYRYVGLILSKIMAIIDTSQIWILAALSVHRCWKLTKPLDSFVRDTPETSKKFICTLFVLVFLFRFPMFFEIQVTKHPHLDIFVVTENFRMTRNFRYNIIYYLILNTIFYNVVPFVLLVVTSSLTLKCVYDARKYRNTPKRQKGETKATVSICIMTFLFLLFHSLFVYEIVQRYRVYVRNDVPKHLLLISDLNTLLSMINCTLNAFVYIAFINRCKQYLQFKFKRLRAIRLKNRKRCLNNNLEVPLALLDTLGREETDEFATQNVCISKKNDSLSRTMCTSKV